MRVLGFTRRERWTVGLWLVLALLLNLAALAGAVWVTVWALRAMGVVE